MHQALEHLVHDLHEARAGLEGALELREVDHLLVHAHARHALVQGLGLREGVLAQRAFERIVNGMIAGNQRPV